MYGQNIFIIMQNMYKFTLFQEGAISSKPIFEHNVHFINGLKSIDFVSDCLCFVLSRLTCIIEKIKYVYCQHRNLRAYCIIQRRIKCILWLNCVHILFIIFYDYCYFVFLVLCSH